MTLMTAGIGNVIQANGGKKKRATRTTNEQTKQNLVVMWNVRLSFAIAMYPLLHECADYSQRELFQSPAALPACLLEDEEKKVEDASVERRRKERSMSWLRMREGGVGEEGGRVTSQTSNQDLTSLFFFF